MTVGFFLYLCTMKRKILLALLIVVSMSVLAKERQQQYTPHHGSWVCKDGTNRYTRALYGSHTDWRLETSDYPIFAVVKKGHHRNIRLVLIRDGVEYPLEQVEHCRALYGSGRREYLLSDNIGS